MKYEKNQYTDGFSYCSLLIAGAFIYWGINTLRSFSWIGLLWLAIGFSIFSGQYYALTNRGKLRNIVLTEFSNKSNITVEEIETKTGISRKDIKAIIMDLKGSGKLRGTFSSQTGEMQLAAIPIVKHSETTVSTPTEAPTHMHQEELGGKKFCNQCGTQIPENEVAKFCPYCGSSLD
ncbi:MAG: zinc ribbon domain-containing protein [Promethearchaeota archaeon]